MPRSTSKIGKQKSKSKGDLDTELQGKPNSKDDNWKGAVCHRTRLRSLSTSREVLLTPDIFLFKAMFSLSPDTCENEIGYFSFSEWSVRLQLNEEYSPEKNHDSQVPWTFDILVLGIYQRDFFVLMESTRIWGGEARSTIKQANEMRFAEKQLEKSRCHGCSEPELTTYPARLSDHQYLVSHIYGREKTFSVHQFNQDQFCAVVNFAFINLIWTEAFRCSINRNLVIEDLRFSQCWWMRDDL
jgi:hypothetical protein